MNGNIVNALKVADQIKTNREGRILYGLCPFCHATSSYRDQEVTICRCCSNKFKWNS